MTPKTPMQVTPNVPKNGVIRALDDIFHREGPLTATDLRSLTHISQSVSDLYEALDMLTGMNVEEVEDLENTGAQDPAKATRVVQARQALVRFNDLTIARVDPEDIDVERLDNLGDAHNIQP